MRTDAIKAANEQQPEQQIRQAICPVCAAAMSKVGNYWKCVRCHFQVCDGCEENGFFLTDYGRTNPPA